MCGVFTLLPLALAAVKLEVGSPADHPRLKGEILFQNHDE
jgi:hypothetical protein